MDPLGGFSVDVSSASGGVTGGAGSDDEGDVVGVVAPVDLDQVVGLSAGLDAAPMADGHGLDDLLSDGFPSWGAVDGVSGH